MGCQGSWEVYNYYLISLSLGHLHFFAHGPLLSFSKLKILPYILTLLSYIFLFFLNWARPDNPGKSHYFNVS